MEYVVSFLAQEAVLYSSDRMASEFGQTRVNSDSPSTFCSESMIRKSSAEAIVDSAVFLFDDERQQETCELTIDGVYGSVSLTWNSIPFSWIRN